MDNTEIKKADTFTLGGKEFTSRFILGSGKFFTGFGESMCGKSRGTDYHTGTPSCK